MSSAVIFDCWRWVSFLFLSQFYCRLSVRQFHTIVLLWLLKIPLSNWPCQGHHMILHSWCACHTSPKCAQIVDMSLTTCSGFRWEKVRKYILCHEEIRCFFGHVRIVWLFCWQVATLFNGLFRSTLYWSHCDLWWKRWSLGDRSGWNISHSHMNRSPLYHICVQRQICGELLRWHDFSCPENVIFLRRLFDNFFPRFAVFND